MPRLRSRKSKSKPRKRVTEEEGWWSIRAIIDERVSNDCTEYLVDWEPDSVTGKTFAPTWSSEVTEEAKTEWQTKKASEAASRANPPPASPTTDGQDSQPPRPANWRQLKRTQPRTLPRRRSSVVESDDDDDNPRKRARIEFSATLSEGSVPSFTSAPSVASAVETPDLDVVDVAYHPRHQLSVEISKVPAFDPAEFQSQSTAQTGSSQSLAELESTDERLALYSQLSQGTVPDSQEPSGQSWSQDRRRSQGVTPVDVPVITSQEQSSAQSPNSPQPITTEQSQEAAAATSAGSDIPSRQPRDSETYSTTQQDTQSSKASLSTPPGPVVAQPASEVYPTFLTQPILPSGSQTGQHFASSSLVRVEATTSEDNSTNTSRQEQLNQRDSQAAQIVRHDIASITRTATASHSIREGSTSASAQETSPHNREKKPSFPSAGFGSSFRAELFSAYAGRLSSRNCSPSSQLSAMEGLDSEQPSSSARRVSAVDELKQLCSFDDIITDLAASHTGDEGQGQESHPVSSEQASTHAEVQMSSNIDSTMPPPPTIALHSQPLEHSSSWVPDSTMISQELESESLTSAPLLTQPPIDALNEVTTQTSSSLQDDMSSGTLLPGPLDIQQITVSPADITRLMAEEPATMDPAPLLAQSGISPRALDLSGESITMAQLPFRNDEDIASLPSSHADHSPVDHLITLPFQARVRPLYDDTILEYRNEVKRFGDIFNSEIYIEPDSSLLARIDELLARLQTLCDYPQDFDGTSLTKLSPPEQAKYAYDANPKFNFVSELLQSLENDTNVLIIARSRDILRLLFYVAQSQGIECRCEAIGRVANLESTTSAVRLTISLPTEQVEAIGYDIVIGFDPTYTQSIAAKQLLSHGSRKPPCVLVLVTTHAIEHIDLRIPGDLPSSERRNALLSGIVRARKLISDPERGIPEPYEVAKIFSDYFNDPHELGVAWEPVAIPDHVLDIYEALQSELPISADSSKDEDNGNKRKLDDEDGGDAKRLRTSPLKESLVNANEPVLSEEVRRMLEGHSTPSIERTNPSEAKILVSVSVLEALAEEHAGYRHKLDDTDYVSEYRSVISGLEKQVKEYERTINQIYEKHRAAIQDRTKFEKEKLSADAALQANSHSARIQAENLQKKISELEATIARHGATLGDQGQGSPEQPLKEAREKIEGLEKKLNSARTQLDFVTNQYQEARSEATTMRTDITELRLVNLQLQQTASENFARIHQIQAEASGKQYLAQISELRTLLKEREVELERTRDELHQMKNGRRETRQVSMPRSPRMGMMSPRTGRGYGGSTSRGTSPAPGSGIEGAGTTPVPGMQYLTQQTGNVRWNHLRE